jgi:hypothetical protein
MVKKDCNTYKVKFFLGAQRWQAIFTSTGGLYRKSSYSREAAFPLRRAYLSSAIYYFFLGGGRRFIPGRQPLPRSFQLYLSGGHLIYACFCRVSRPPPVPRQHELSGWRSAFGNTEHPVGVFVARKLNFHTLRRQKIIRHPTSDIRHPTSDIRHPTSDIRLTP